MNWRPWLPVPLVGLATLILTWQVHARAGDETIRCVDAPQTECMVGSGASWLLTGITITAPTLIHLGWRWTARLNRQKKLDPLRRLVIPDYEEILEIVSVVLALAASVWIIRSGPTFGLVDGGFPNTWLGESLGTQARDVPLVPTRGAWFLIGALMSAPFSFAAGSAVGREWFGWKRRRGTDSLAEASSEATETDTEDAETLDLDAEDADADAGVDEDAEADA